MSSIPHFEGPSLVVGVSARSHVSQNLTFPGQFRVIQKCVEGVPLRFLRASISEVASWREQGISSVRLHVQSSIDGADRVFQRYRHLGFDVTIDNYTLLRSDNSFKVMLEETQVLYQNAWCFLHFILPKKNAQPMQTPSLQVLCDMLEPLREMSELEGRIIARAWSYGISHWGGLRGVSGVRSAMRIIESENLHLLRLALTRVRNNFQFGIPIFQLAIQRLRERRRDQLGSVEKLLVRI